jgi:hypothetical protein
MRNKAKFVTLCEEYEPNLPFGIEILERIRSMQLDGTDVQIIIDYITDKKRRTKTILVTTLHELSLRKEI